jgi:hypothetical protein
MPMTDQVATARCTDLFQARSPTFEARPRQSLTLVSASGEAGDDCYEFRGINRLR